MSQTHANNQPEGFKNHLQNIAIVGAAGQQGAYIVDALLKTGKQNITAITRSDSNAAVPAGVKIAKISYDDQSSIVSALRGQDALVITMSVMAPPDQQTKLIEAAAAAGVPWVLPNEFGGTGEDPAVNDDIPMNKAKAGYRAHIESLGKSSWIGVACGFWYEYSLGSGPIFFGFDIPNKKATFYDEKGSVRMNTSTRAQSGRAVAALLNLKILPDDASDKSPSLSQFKNSFICVSSFTVSQSDMLASLQRVTGTGPADWTIEHVPAKERYKQGVEELQGGNRMGFAKMLYGRSFYPEEPALYEQRRTMQTELLGLPKDDLDEATRFAVRISEGKAK